LNDILTETVNLDKPVGDAGDQQRRETVESECSALDRNRLLLIDNKSIRSASSEPTFDVESVNVSLSDHANVFFVVGEYAAASVERQPEGGGDSARESSGGRGRKHTSHPARKHRQHGRKDSGTEVGSTHEADQCNPGALSVELHPRFHLIIG
jgi:hypothetical protein